MTSLIPSPSIQLINGLPVVSSLTVAGHFEKPHSDVLKIVRKVASEVSHEFGEGNFSLSSYTSEQGKELPMYLLTRDGFSLVVMGFTGKKALEWKVKYIEAFNAMEKALSAPKPKALPKPNRRDELIDIYMKAFQLRHDMLVLETDIRKLYDDQFCTVKRSVPKALYPYVQEDDDTMNHLISACTGSIKALQHTLETRMVQLV